MQSSSVRCTLFFSQGCSSHFSSVPAIFLVVFFVISVWEAILFAWLCISCFKFYSSLWCSISPRSGFVYSFYNNHAWSRVPIVSEDFSLHSLVVGLLRNHLMYTHMTALRGDEDWSIDWNIIQETDIVSCIMKQIQLVLYISAQLIFYSSKLALK